MNEQQARELLDIVFVVYFTEETLLGEDESPVVGVRSDLDSAMKLAFERLLQDSAGEVRFVVAVEGPFPGGRVHWLVETDDSSLSIEAMRLSGEPIDGEVVTWLMDPARFQHSQA